MSTDVFINIPVEDLEASKKFYTKWGWTVIPEYTDDNASCLNISENIFLMLLTKEFFPTFINKPIADTSTHSAAIYCISFDRAEEVDERANAALSAGATKGKEIPDMGMPDMHIKNFFDLDGHAWELMYMPAE